jgi:putative endonuclease
LPVKLVYTECFNTKSEAMKMEYQIKQLTRQQKLKLIREKQ